MDKKDLSISDISSKFSNIINEKPGRRFYYTLSIAFIFSIFGFIGAYYTLTEGISVFGLNTSVIWGLSIASFVFWIGIGHAGTLISAILYLFNQKWRSPIHRSAEAMTIIAVVMAGLFLFIHTGRPWFATYWLFPYPSQMGMWVNFTSPLIWDLFAILSYFILSLLFWYYGLVPDLAFYKNKVNSRFKKWFYDVFSLGFYGSHKQWYYYKKTYLIFAGLATAMVISVHTIVSFDFAVTILHGWHSTIFPFYFVAGAIFSGLAFVIILLLIVRYSYQLEDYITHIHLDKLNKIFLAMSIIIFYSYIMEFFTAWFSGNEMEQIVFIERISGSYSLLYWFSVFANVVLPQLLWSKRIRSSIALSFIISIIVTIGMWLERFIIVVTSLYSNFLPDKELLYIPTWVELSFLLGSFGMFTILFLLFIRLLPIMSVYELKSGVNK